MKHCYLLLVKRKSWNILYSGFVENYNQNIDDFMIILVKFYLWASNLLIVMISYSHFRWFEWIGMIKWLSRSINILLIRRSIWYIEGTMNTLIIWNRIENSVNIIIEFSIYIIKIIQITLQKIKLLCHVSFLIYFWVHPLLKHE